MSKSESLSNDERVNRVLTTKMLTFVDAIRLCPTIRPALRAKLLLPCPNLIILVVALIIDRRSVHPDMS